MQLGQIGNLRGNFDYAYNFVNTEDEENGDAEGNTGSVTVRPDAHLAQISTRVALERIGGTPIGVGYEYSWESASSGSAGDASDRYKSNSRHMVVVQGAW